MNEEPISIAVDVMGGDNAPSAIIDGVGMALDRFGDAFRLLLVGDQASMEEELKRIGKLGDSRLELVHSSEVIMMGEHPVSAVRHKRDSSINVAVKLVRDGKAAGVFSAGSTGAAVASAYFNLKMLEGIERPGIATTMPSETGRFVLLDAGASVDCSPANLVHYAVMGSIYASQILKIENPRVALICNGTEDGKGNRLTQSAFQMLQDVDINFIGNCEGHDLFSGKVDVVVCDGFVGNVMLKSCEQLAKSIGHLLKKSLMSHIMSKFGAMLSRQAFHDLKQAMDPAEYGGAPLLGVKGVVIIGHGISDGKSVCNGIRAAGEAVKQEINSLIAEQVKNIEIPLNL
ncbi:MAG: phosphate acyltransferase PlsX [Victivallales bacterium]|nr:phosphate acyltransferase PlsX [Victivallales bacterium]